MTRRRTTLCRVRPNPNAKQTTLATRVASAARPNPETKDSKLLFVTVNASSEEALDFDRVFREDGVGLRKRTRNASVSVSSFDDFDVFTTIGSRTASPTAVSVAPGARIRSLVRTPSTCRPRLASNKFASMRPETETAFDPDPPWEDEDPSCIDPPPAGSNRSCATTSDQSFLRAASDNSPNEDASCMTTRFPRASSRRHRGASTFAAATTCASRSHSP